MKHFFNRLMCRRFAVMAMAVALCLGMAAPVVGEAIWKLPQMDVISSLWYGDSNESGNLSGNASGHIWGTSTGDASGSVPCDDPSGSIVWSIVDGVLTVSGKGNMPCFDANYSDCFKNNLTSAPWGDYAGELTAVIIRDGLTSVGSKAFCGCESIMEVSLPAELKTIEASAFADCDSLTDVHYNGTQEQWKGISIKEGNEAIGSAQLHYATSPADVDGDGVADRTDLTILARHIAGIERLADVSRADVNGDGCINAADLTALAEALAS